MQNEHVTLYLKEGSSDKVYQVDLEEVGGGWVVHFAYGRRGNALKAGTKTPTARPYEDAKGIFDALVREKVAKGYSPGADGQRFQGTEFEGQATAIQPQLLNDVDPRHLEALLASDAYAVQEKYDGKRLLVEKQGASVRGVNRRGLVVPLPEGIANHIAALPDDVILDGELVGDSYHVFDLVMKGPYGARLACLETLLGPATLRHDPRPVRPVWTAFDTVSKRNLLDLVRGRRGEGVVVKSLDAPYTPGRPNSGGPQLKVKFTTTASCIVAGHNEGKRSVKLALLEGKVRVPVGNVKIPGIGPLPDIGQICEIRYLHAFDGGSLYQPVYLGLRDDVPESDCVLSQLKYKPDAEDA